MYWFSGPKNTMSGLEEESTGSSTYNDFTTASKTFVLRAVWSPGGDNDLFHGITAKVKVI